MRTLLRGARAQLPSGQEVADALVQQGRIASGDRLTISQLTADTCDQSGSALRKDDLAQNSPLFYYLLKEAELKAGGLTLGPIGSHIVSETIQGALEADPQSYLSMMGLKWDFPFWRFPSGAMRPINSLIGIVRLIGDDQTPAGMRNALAPLSCLSARTARESGDVTGGRPWPPPRGEIDAIIRGAADNDIYSARSRWAVDMRRFLSALPDFEFETARATPLMKLCAAGVAYGWRELEKSSGADLMANLSVKARASLRRNLRSDLGQVTQPCFDLEWKSFGLAVASLGLARSDPKLVEHRFLGDRPSHRLFSLFKKFPVLARLWSQLIRQWREHVDEVLTRFVQDRRALSRTFFAHRPLDKILDACFGLSDRHNSGRELCGFNLKRTPSSTNQGPAQANGNGSPSWAG